MVSGKEQAAETRKGMQLRALLLMQIDGKNANEGGLSCPGRGDNEFQMSSHCGWLEYTNKQADCTHS